MRRYYVIFLFFFSVLLIEHQVVAQEELSEAYLEQQDAIFEYKNGNTSAAKRFGNGNAATSPPVTTKRVRTNYLDMIIELLTAFSLW